MLFRSLADFLSTGKMREEVYDGKRFFWVKYDSLIKQLPVIGISSTDAMQRRLKRIVSSGVLEHRTVRCRGTFSYYSLTAKYSELLYSDEKSEGYGSKVGGGTDETSELITLLAKDSSNKHSGAGAPAEEIEKPDKPKQSKASLLLSAIEDVSVARREAFTDWLEYKAELKNSYKPRGFATLVKTWGKYTDAEFRYAVDRSMSNGWKGLFEPTDSPSFVSQAKPVSKDVCPDFV